MIKVLGVHDGGVDYALVLKSLVEFEPLRRPKNVLMTLEVYETEAHDCASNVLWGVLLDYCDEQAGL